jgi:hypothetical protein
LNTYGSLFAALHPHTWKEVKAMAKSRRRKLEFDVRPWVETLGLPELIRQIGPDTVLEGMAAAEIVANLPKRKREELRRLLTAQEKDKP